MSNIEQSLTDLFKKHKVVFWYDNNQTLFDEYEQVQIEGLEKRQVNGNEFETKYAIIKSAHTQKFLLYFPYSEPQVINNWLIDIQLANRVFHTEKEAVHLQELGLPYEYRTWMAQHISYFENKERLAHFKSLLKPVENVNGLNALLCQAILGSDDAGINTMLRKLSLEFVANRAEQLMANLEKYNASQSFWDAVNSRYYYKADKPLLKGFLLELFLKTFGPTKAQSVLSDESHLLIASWKDSISFKEAFENLSSHFAKELNIESLTSALSLEELLAEDNYEVVEQMVIKHLVAQLANDSINGKKLEKAIKARESSFWFGKYQNFYNCLKKAQEIVQLIKEITDLPNKGLENAIELYTDKWYKVDYLYRSFISNYKVTNQNTVLTELYRLVEKIYNNNWLLKLADYWQTQLNPINQYPLLPFAQTGFFNTKVQPFLNKGHKVFVVISDALRFEAGKDFQVQLSKEQRFLAKTDYMLSTWPSYTQLGMAALLPHKSLKFGPKKDEVLLDSKSTIGIEPRTKILQSYVPQSTAIHAADIMKMNSRSAEAQDLVKKHEVVYVYNDQIDKMGDDKTSEHRVIEATNDEIEFLIMLCKKLANMNVNNILVTSDHGFLYQNEPLAESDFVENDLEGEFQKTSRRFVIGKLTAQSTKVLTFKANALGLDNDLDVCFPKGINRLPVSGSGSRFVHGGLMPQETILPLIHITKKRQDTLKAVDVDIFNKGNAKITTNLCRIKFYQIEPITEGITGRVLKAFFRSKGGEMLSNPFNFEFNLTYKNAGDREVQHVFQIASAATAKYSNQTVYLVLEELVEGTGKYIKYAEYPFTIAISMDKDFDDF